MHHHYTLISSADYLLCRTELREHTNKSVSDLHLNDDAVQILTDEKYNPRLLSELLSHESFHKFMTDLEIYIDGFTKIFDTSHIETEQYYITILLEDLKPIVSDLRNAHMKDSNTASDIDYQSMVKNIIDDFTSPTQIATEDAREASNDAYINGLLLLFCKNLEMKITQLSVEEKQTLKEISSRSKPAKEHRKLRR